MNRRILTLCKYLVATSILFATVIQRFQEDHPAFKFKSNFANLKPISKFIKNGPKTLSRCFTMRKTIIKMQH